MRISSINSINLYQKRNENASLVTTPSNFGISLSKPLEKDTISFSKPNIAQNIWLLIVEKIQLT